MASCWPSWISCLYRTLPRYADVGQEVPEAVLVQRPLAARDQEPPLLYSGARLPAEFVEKAAAFLRAAGLFSDGGYLHCPTDAAKARITDG